MPVLNVNQTLLCWLSAVPTPILALDVHRGGIPGQPGAYDAGKSVMTLSSGRGFIPSEIDKLITRRDFRFCGNRHQIISGTQRVKLQLRCDQRHKPEERGNMFKAFDARAWRIVAVLCVS